MALRTKVTNKTSVVLLPRVPCSISGMIHTVGDHARTKGRFAVVTITRNTVAGRSTTLPGGGLGRGRRGGNCPSITCRLTRGVRGHVSRRIHVAIPKRARENKDPYPCSHILTAELKTTTTSLVLGRSCKCVMKVGGNGVHGIPLKRITKGLGVMSPGTSVVGRTGVIKVDFNSRWEDGLAYRVLPYVMGSILQGLGAWGSGVVLSRH